MSQVFDEDYYLRGPSTGKSNYEDYRWMPDLTMSYANHLQRHLGIVPGDAVLDFGCARGYLVKALREYGINTVGYDISKWAIENCDPDVRGVVFNSFPSGLGGFDWIHAKDVWEHLEVGDLLNVVRLLAPICRKGILAIVPLSTVPGGPYIYDPDNKDPSHLIAWNLETWIKYITVITDNIIGIDFTVSGSYHMEGLKLASKTHNRSTGFIIIRRYK